MTNQTQQQEQDAPVNWHAVVERRERELKTVGEARHRAEAAIARVRRLCDMTISDSVRFEAVQQARDTLAALDEPAPVSSGPAATEPSICPHGADTSHCPCLACEAEQPDPRQPAYDAVYAYLSHNHHIPRDLVTRNAMIWRGVHAALGAQAERDQAALARVREWVNSDVVTAQTGFGNGYREALRDIRDLLPKEPAPQEPASSGEGR